MAQLSEKSREKKWKSPESQRIIWATKKEGHPVICCRQFPNVTLSYPLAQIISKNRVSIRNMDAYANFENQGSNFYFSDFWTSTFELSEEDMDNERKSNAHILRFPVLIKSNSSEGNAWHGFFLRKKVWRGSNIFSGVLPFISYVIWGSYCS